MNCLPELVTPLINEYKLLLNEYLGEYIYGVYLYNSVTNESYEHKTSDVDFVTVLKKELLLKDIITLIKIHRILEKRFSYGNLLEGMYIVHEDLVACEKVNGYIYYSEGTITPRGHYDLNNVTRWMLAHTGIAVCGQPIDTLNLHVEYSDLLDTMKYNIFEYWANNIDRIDTDEDIEFAVLTLARILYTIDEEGIVPKRVAANYVKDKYDHMKAIIDEGLNIRDGNKDSIYETHEVKKNATKELLVFVQERYNTKVV